MAKYSKGASKKVEKSMHEMHEGKLKSGGSGKKVNWWNFNIGLNIKLGKSEKK